VTDLTYADVVEGVRAAISRYTLALDDGRTGDVVATFCADGTCTIPGLGTHTGRDALHAAFTSWEPRGPQRHLVLNTLVTDWSSTEARATSDVIFISLGRSGWAIRLVGRYDDVLRREGDEWRFHRRAATFVEPPA
jgi:hypothetical protein